MLNLNWHPATALALSATALGTLLLLVTWLLWRRRARDRAEDNVRPAVLQVLGFWAICSFAVGMLGLLLR